MRIDQRCLPRPRVFTDPVCLDVAPIVSAPNEVTSILKNAQNRVGKGVDEKL